MLFKGISQKSYHSDIGKKREKTLTESSLFNYTCIKMFARSLIGIFQFDLVNDFLRNRFTVFNKEDAKKCKDKHNRTVIEQ